MGSVRGTFSFFPRKSAKELNGLDNLVLPITHDSLPMTDIYHVFHQYTIRVLNSKREKLQKYLAGNGIETMVYYPVPLHEMAVFRNRMIMSNEGLAKAELAAKKELLSLPIPAMKPEEALLVADLIKQGLNEKNYLCSDPRLQ